MSDKLEIVAALVDETEGPLAALTARLEALTAKVDELNGTMAESGKATASSISGSATALEGLQSKLNTFSSATKAIGTQLSTTVTLPIIGIGVAAAKMATSFQQQMEILHTEAGVPIAALAGLSTSIENLANQVGFSPTSLAEAMYHIESNGKGLLTAAQAMDQLKISAEAAAMTGASLDDTTYTLSSTLASGIGGAKGYADMMGVLNGIVGAGDMKFQDLNAAIGTGFFATAAQFGISVQSMGAALATLTDNGESADEAATRLRMSVTLMDAPSAQAAKVLSALGLSGTEVKASTDAATQALADAHVTTTKLADDMRKPDGLNVALMDLESHLKSSGLSANAADAAIAKAFGGGRSDAAILTLLNNTKRTQEAFDQINGNESRFADDWATQQQTAQQKFKNAWAAIQSDLTRLGTAVLPAATRAFTQVAAAITNVTNWFEKLSPAQQDNVLKLALILAAVGPVLVILGTLAGSISKIIMLFELFGPAAQVGMRLAMAGLSSLTGGASLATAGVAILQATIATPVILALSIAAAIAALAYVMEKVGEVRSAIAGVQQSYAQFNQVSSGLAAAANKLPNGPEKTRMLALANQAAPQLDSSTKFWSDPLGGVGSWLLNSHANGGVFDTPHIAQVAEAGAEAIIPLTNPARAQEVMRNAGLGGGGGDVTVNMTNIINTPLDMDSVGRDLAWRLAGAN